MAASIDDLPAELLLPVFEYASLDDRPQDPPSAVDELGWATATRRDPSTSTNISQVCSRWRQLSLSQQVLWGYLPRSCETMTDLYLSRCPSSPLHIEIRPDHLYNGMDREHVQKLLDIVPRAVSLHISFKPGLKSARKSRAFSTSSSDLLSFLRTLRCAPQLEDLWMDLPPCNPHGFLKFPCEMFRGQVLEKLHSVAFNDVLLQNPCTLVWPALRSACFTNSQVWDTADSFVAFFSGMPCLEDFKLTRRHRAIRRMYERDSTSVQSLPPSRSVPMVNLKSFILHGLSLDIFLTLALLQIPFSALVSLTLFGRWNVEDSRAKLKIMHAALRDHFAAAVQADVHFDSVVFANRAMTAACNPQNNSTTLLPAAFTLDIPSDDARLEPIGSRSLGMLCSHPVFARAAHLTIRSPADDPKIHGNAHILSHIRESLSIPELEHILELYSEVRTLVVEGAAVRRLVGGFLIPEGRGPLKLTVLRLRDARLYSKSFFDMNTISTPQLLRTLRRLRTKKLERLELERCILKEVDVRTLRRILGEGVIEGQVAAVAAVPVL
ncbi:hypothetical protein PENSPDRAFT_659102 [Peniophora sp. CONT]|nr:hypothetical protein PENSPDRAFT_659102 [Peniophora sp. CONT]